MTANVTNLGPNSNLITFASTTQAEIASNINALLVAAGYTLFDAVSSTVNVYRNQCVDGSTYKYFKVTVGSTTAITFDVYGSWNAITHVGTNQASVSSSVATSGSITINTTTLSLYVFAASRYVYIFANSNSTYTGAGVFEFVRENTYDTVAFGAPSYFLTTNTLLGNATGTTVGGAPSNLAGTTGYAAATYSALVSPLGIIGGITGSTAQIPGGLGSYNFYPAVTPTYWSNFNNSGTLSEYRGKVYGLKLLPKAYGTLGDNTNIKVDSSGFSDPAGTTVNHFIFFNYCLPL